MASAPPASPAKRPSLRLGQVAGMTLPLAATAAVQVVMNLTDAWIVGQKSSAALAAISLAHWPSLLALALLGGIAQSLQVGVARAEGAGRSDECGDALRVHFLLIGWVAPLCIALAVAGPALLAMGSPDAALAEPAIDYWVPRFAGLPLALALAALLAFWNGLGRTRLTLAIAATVAVANSLLAALFVLGLDAGAAGAAHATNLAQAVGVGIGLRLVLARPVAEVYGMRRWRLPSRPAMLAQARLALPMGLIGASGIAGVAAFQWMHARVSAIDAAASALALALSSLTYVPALALSLAITTLVGRELGAGRIVAARALAARLIRATAAIMAVLGTLLAALGPFVAEAFTPSRNPMATEVIVLTSQLLWIAALYQAADGFNTGAVAALRAAGDVIVPALIAWTSSATLLVPLAHLLAFGTEDGFWRQPWGAGLGALGGWSALALHVCLVGAIMHWRWQRSPQLASLHLYPATLEHPKCVRR